MCIVCLGKNTNYAGIGMSLFKTVALVGVVIAVMPSERKEQYALIETAYSVNSRVRSFCENRPNICLSREQAWEGFKVKAEFAYALGSELIFGQTSYSAPSPQSRDQIGSLLKYERSNL
jgi:hypothetical protein